MAQKRKTKLFSPRSILIIGITLLVIGALVLTLRHKPNKGSGIIPSSKINRKTENFSNKRQVEPSTNNSGQTDKNSMSANQPTTGNGATLIAPSGTFVSNHRPNLKNSPAPSKIESVCATTTGTICYIQFTKDGIIKTLPAQTVGNDGVTIWDWDINKAGFTTGSWEITAIASLSGQTKTTVDPMKLEVQP